MRSVDVGLKRPDNSAGAEVCKNNKNYDNFNSINKPLANTED